MEKIWIKKELYILSYEFFKFMSLFRFLNEFFIKFSYFKKSQKGGTYPQMLTWRAGPAGELMWCAGPLRGCDVALRPRGRATGGPRKAQVAHRARTRGRRPRMSTRTPVRVPRGERGWRVKGPRVSGPW